MTPFPPFRNPFIAITGHGRALGAWGPSESVRIPVVRVTGRGGVAAVVTLQTEGQEGGEDLFIGHRGGPAVGRVDGGVQGAVGVVEPGGAAVVEVRQGPLGEGLGGGGVAGTEASRE
jgi:hypothetical protein